MINRPTYISQLIPLVDKDIIKVLVGFRRSGKSILLELMKQYLLKNGREKEQFITLNFEDFENFELRNPHKLHRHLKDLIAQNPNKTYLFLDEIQAATGFEEVINSLRVSENVDIYITGSNATLLSGELATLLAGRYLQVFVYPFGFQEYIEAKKELGEKKNTDEFFNSFLVEGGMPFIVSQELPDFTKDSYLKDIYNSVILKDIVERNQVRDTDLLERTVQFVFDNVGQIFSASSIAKYLKSQQRSGKADTLLNYLKYGTEAQIFYPLRRYDLKGKQYFQTNEKYYLVDQGLREAMLHRNRQDIQQILENIVLLEAIRRGYTATVGVLGNYEIDFVLEKGGNRIYLQVSYLLASEETVEREFRPLLKLEDNYRKIVLSMDPISQPRDGVEHLKIPEFLLSKEW
ncbi:MAG: ATP-binding protein [Streptococcaceae bacterium]|jgi:predicted AAA+ superfamily ATPase|nr:ATP-binding protein [Streptococcaceae bacterium]